MPDSKPLKTLALSACLAALCAGPVPGRADPGTEHRSDTAERGADAAERGADAAERGADAAEHRADYPYTVKLTGDYAREVGKLLDQASGLVAQAEDPPISELGLRRRAEADAERLTAALRSLGYYDSSIETEIDLDRSPASIEVRIAPGPQYRFGAIEIGFAESDPDEKALAVVDAVSLPDREAPAASERAVLVEAQLLDGLFGAGFVWARIEDRLWEVDHLAQTLTGSLRVSTGRRARYGPLIIEGLDEVKERYVRTLIDWKEGEHYSPRAVDRVRRALTATRLFESARVVREEPVDDSVSVPMRVTLSERAKRTVGAGAGYDSVDGVGGTIFWEHRNLFGEGQRLRLTAFGSEREFGGRVAYRHPAFLDDQQALLVDASYSLEDTRAYESRKVVTSVGIERRISRRVTGRFGASFEHGPVEAEAAEDGLGGVEQTFTLVGLPGSLSYDAADDILAPTRGLRVGLELTPYARALGSDLTFLVSRITGRAYLPLDANRRAVFATRVSAGSIAGSGRAGIPIDKRFFAGGGGSIRGYEFQSAGPLLPDADEPEVLRPVGGRSLMELSAELRYRVTETLGFAAFVDAGNVFGTSVPDPSEEMLMGAGGGLRYYSPIGPLRFDIATPVNGRDTDDPVQVYISIGETY